MLGQTTPGVMRLRERLLEAASIGDTPVALRDRALFEVLYGAGARVEPLLADVPQRRTGADDDLRHRVEQALALAPVALPDLGLGALLEHDQDAPVQRDAGRVGDRGQHDRGLDAHAAGDIAAQATATAVLGEIPDWPVVAIVDGDGGLTASVRAVAA